MAEGSEDQSKVIKEQTNSAVNLGIAGFYTGLGAGAKEGYTIKPGAIGWVGNVVTIAVGLIQNEGDGTGLTCSIVGAVGGTAAGYVAGTAAGAATEAAATASVVGAPAGPVLAWAAASYTSAKVGDYANGKLVSLCDQFVFYISTPATASTASQTTTQAMQQASNTLPPPAPSAPPQTSTSAIAQSVTSTFRPSPDYQGSNGAYKVQSGETLTSIASNNAISLKDLETANPQISDFNSIRAGQIVQLPTNASNYHPGSGGGLPTGASLPDANAQDSALNNLLANNAGQQVTVVAENSGQIAVIQGNGTVAQIANDGSVNTLSYSAYLDQVQNTYNGYLQAGYLSPSDLLAFSDYQTGTYGYINAGATSGTIVSGSGAVSFDANGSAATVSSTGQVAAFDASTGQVLEASTNGNQFGTQYFDANGNPSVTTQLVSRADGSSVFTATNADGTTAVVTTSVDGSGHVNGSTLVSFSDAGDKNVETTTTYDGSGNTLSASTITRATDQTSGSPTFGLPVANVYLISDLPQPSPV